MFHTELEMANLVTCLHSVIMTIPGIGFINGGMILGEIDDIHRFSEPKKLLVFAGLIHWFISLVISRHGEPECPSEIQGYYAILL